MDGTEASLDHLLRHAELELDAERRAALVPVLEQIGPAIAAVRAVEVGELPPATAFDARWE
jgi:hypothetical protein